MIKKLRIKFVAVNMTIVTLMLCIILGLVYWFTSASLESQSVRMMKAIVARPFGQSLPNQPDEEVRLPFFSIRLGPKGERITAGGSYYDLSNEQFLDGLVLQASASPRRLGELPDYNLRYCLLDTPRGRYLVFADISSEIATLSSLMKYCLIIGGLGFLAFFGLSVLLSGWAVRPVDRALKQQRQFIADASHELKTPLTVIMTSAQLMQNPDAPAENRQKFSANILTVAHQMKELVDQMLQLARAESAEARPVYGRVELSQMLEKAVLPFEPVFFEKGLTLTTQIQPGIQLSGDETRLRQVAEVLLDNAQKYAKPGARAWVTLKKHGRRHCILAVADEGEPISPQQLQDMFKRFYRADEARSSNGSFGLGLAIAKSIVAAHKGRIWAESKNGVNTCFVELPCL